jgi:hypothetical protein
MSRLVPYRRKRIIRQQVLVAGSVEGYVYRVRL